MEAYVERLAVELDREFQRVNPETVCAFVAEPVVGAVSSASWTMKSCFENLVSHSQ